MISSVTMKNAERSIAAKSMPKAIRLWLALTRSVVAGGHVPKAEPTRRLKTFLRPSRRAAAPTIAALDSSGGGSAEDILKSMFGGGGPDMGGMGGAGMGADPRMGGAGMGGPGMGGAGMGGQARRQPRPAKGDDIKATARVTLEEVLAGDKVQVSLPGQGAVKIALPEGVEDGQTIRLKGKGKASATGGKLGDALVTVKYASHPSFKTDGSTLLMELPVTLDEAVLGARISVETLDGKVALTLPENAQSGRTMRLKERGLPTKGGKRGDLLIKVLIKLPEEGDEALAALMKRWRTDGRYTVR